jgi:hypothetical protein
MFQVPRERFVDLDDSEQSLGRTTSLRWTTILLGDPAAAITEVRSILGGSGYDPK